MENQEENKYPQKTGIPWTGPQAQAQAVLFQYDVITDSELEELNMQENAEVLQVRAEIEELVEKKLIRPMFERLFNSREVPQYQAMAKEFYASYKAVSARFEELKQEQRAGGIT